MRKPRAIICGQKIISKVLEDFLALRGYEVVSFSSPMVCPIDKNDNVSCEKSNACSDIIISDFMMPLINGAEMFKAQSLRGCRVPVTNKALMSACVGDNRLREIQHAGYKTFAKPLKFSLLSEWLDELKFKMDLSQPLGIARKEHRNQSKMDVKCMISSDNSTVTGIVTNISLSGLCVKLDVPIMEKQKMSVLFNRTHNCRPALMRWMRKSKEGHYLAGFSFILSNYWSAPTKEEPEMVREDLQYIIKLVERGGPKPDDYIRLDHTWQRIMSNVRNGNLPQDVVRDACRFIGAFANETMQAHVVNKPYGYAGDFEMIDRIYQYSLCENPDFRRWDEYFQSREACQAVRNRKVYFKKLLNMTTRHGSLRVLNVGSGPARDILEFLSFNNGNTVFDCVDMDSSAISYAKSICADICDRVTFHNTNIFHFRSDYSYKVIWSAGLFDYLDDRSFVILLRRLLKMLEPGGQLVIGNFSTANPSRDYMEFGDWILKHRSRDELLSLAKSCQIKDLNTFVGEEPQGINLFLHMERQV
jgi:extracellular factor (EF) 3-hydroxypalmitic acid methyl ester biosynthesis protein